MQLTEHFSLEELTASETAARKEIDNTPGPDIMPHLQVLAQGLEEIRKALRNLPIHINSGYRSPALNAAIGGSGKSAHMQGLAADIVCPQFGTPLDVCRAIEAAGLATDQIIHEYGRWCHVAFARPGGVARKQTLTIAKPGSKYATGLHPVDDLRLA